MPTKTEIVSYNINGIRAAMKHGLADWLAESDYDIVCLQEIKALPNQIDEEPFKKLGYECHWYSAKRKGYSGVGILTKRKPKHIERGMGLTDYDDEGRWLRLDFDEFSVVSAYFPSGSSKDERQAFKMQFLADVDRYLVSLTSDFPNLILCGDYNICHRAIDIHDPVRNKKSSGFLPEEREWMTRFFDSGFVDSFRRVRADQPDRYSWWSYRGGARQNNKGWRIDYNAVSAPLADRITDADIFPNARHSDHCPVYVRLDI